MTVNYWWLALAIGCEVIATTALKASDGMQHWRPGVLVVLGYCCAFYALGLALRTIPIGVAYAIWSGVGIVMVSVIGYFLFRQALTMTQCLGIGMIAAGVIVLQSSDF
ncbi:DMT family transporter [Polaromonas sp.]|uniref:DMT family transporter n=1 Tax=Polaromonas sp. TaxID=1869339 RepID=UPI003BB4BDFF